MGGINSGRRRSVHRGTVEQHPAIDLRMLVRAGLLKPGECAYDTMYWQNQDLDALEVRIFVDLSDIEDASLRIIATEGNITINQTVEIECVPCPYGGVRAYFRCPLNGSRYQLLFFADGLFASRKAHRLTYASQSEDDLSRAHRKVRKLHRQVEGDGRYARPRGTNRYGKVLQLKQAKHDARELYRERLRTTVGDFGN